MVRKVSRKNLILVKSVFVLGKMLYWLVCEVICLEMIVVSSKLFMSGRVVNLEVVGESLNMICR